MNIMFASLGDLVRTRAINSKTSRVSPLGWLNKPNVGSSMTYNPITLLVNERFYRSLPEDVQRSLDRSAAEALAYQSEVARELKRDAMEMESAGVVVSRRRSMRSSPSSVPGCGKSWPLVSKGATSCSSASGRRPNAFAK